MTANFLKLIANFVGVATLGAGLMAFPSWALKDTDPQTPEFCDDFKDIEGGEGLLCGSLKVPEDHLNPSGKKINYSYVVLKAKEGPSKASPMIYFHGGPGGVVLFKGAIQYWLTNSILESRDIILVDQRGVGNSSALPNIKPGLFNIMAQDIQPEEEFDQIETLLQDVAKQSKAQGIDLSHYNTLQSSKDVGVLMDHLGYQKYNLNGGSYGTRLARRVQDDFPDLVNSVIHDSIAPSSADFLMMRLSTYNVAMQRIFDYCAQNAECSDQYPNLQQTYLTLLSTLKTEPLTVPFKGGSFVVNPQDALYLMRRLAYSSQSRTLVPSLIKALVDGKGEILDMIINAETPSPYSINYSLLMSVERFETFDTANSAKVIDDFYGDLPLLPTKLAVFDALYQAGMKSWHGKTMSKEENKTIISNIPSLIMTNYYDPATPIESAYIFQKSLPNSFLLILDEGGHGGGNEKCKERVMNDFMNKPTVKPDLSCLNIYKD